MIFDALGGNSFLYKGEEEFLEESKEGQTKCHKEGSKDGGEGSGGEAI